MSKLFDDALKNIDKVFETPRAILASPDFDRTEKIKLLQNWDYDVRLRLVASEENMTGIEPQGTNSERLREIGEALEALGVVADDKGTGSSKTGAPDLVPVEKAKK